LCGKTEASYAAGGSVAMGEHHLGTQRQEHAMTHAIPRPSAVPSRSSRDRTDLVDVATALVRAVSRPATREGEWLADVHKAVLRVQDELDAHRAMTRRPGGQYADLLEIDPRLGSAVARLVAEQDELVETIARILRAIERAEPTSAAVGPVRERVRRMSRTLVRHAHRSDDLIHEAYDVDLGGEA
jgi:hypothetical protein